MQMQKGICIEVEDNRSVFMLPNGHFMKGQPATKLAVGEEGYFYPLAAKKKISRTAFWAPVLAAVAVFVLLFSMFQPPEEAYAYVQVQINPGVEIGVGENGKTISLRGLNKDGEELVSNLIEWENQPLDQVLNRVISLSVSNTTEEITITTVKEDSAKLSLEAAVIAVSSRAVNDHVEVQLKKATKDQWRKSVKEKIPVSKLVPDSTLIKSGKLNKEKDKKNHDIKPENPGKGTGKEKTKTKDETKDKNRDKETKGKNEGKETKDKNKEKDNKHKEKDNKNKEKENRRKADSLNKIQKGNNQREKEQKVPSVKPKEKANSKAQEKKSNTNNNAHKKKKLPSKAKEKNKASHSSAKDKKEKVHPRGKEKKKDKPKQDKKSAEKKKVIPSQKEKNQKKSKEKKQKKQSGKASKNKEKKNNTSEEKG